MVEIFTGPIMEKQKANFSSRFLHWEACINTRELGGYPTHSGKQIRWKTLIRSDDTCLLTPTGQQALLDYGVRTVIDLRFAYELKMNPSPFADHTLKKETAPVDYINIPLDVDQDLIWSDLASPAEMMSDLYIRILEKNRGHVAAVLTAIACARPGCVLFHCHAGQDRTGLIAALILASAGAPEEHIVEDYALSHSLIEQRRERILADPALTPERRRSLRVLITALPETMQRTLQYLDQQYRGAKGYIQTTPLLPADLDRLKERLIGLE